MAQRAAEGPQLGRELDHVREEAAASTRLEIRDGVAGQPQLEVSSGDCTNQTGDVEG